MRHHTTSLPQSLVEELDLPRGLTRRNSRKAPYINRKDVRKQKRIGEKQKKSNFFSKPSSAKSYQGEPEHQSPRKTNGIRPSKIKNGSSLLLKRSVSYAIDDSDMNKRPIGTLPVKINPQQKASQQRKVLDLDPNLFLDSNPEDIEIARLEKLLGVKQKSLKSQKIPYQQHQGTFDDLLDDLDKLVDSDGEESIYQQFETDESDSHSNQGEGSEIPDFNGMDEDTDGSEWAGIEAKVNPQDGPEQLVTAGYAQSDHHILPQISSVATRYIPPHLREETGGNVDGTQQRLRKQVTGLLNRLSEQNIGSILSEYEEIYRSQKRHEVTNTTTEFLIENLSSRTSLSESYVSLHAAFVSSLHKVIGMDFAAHFAHQVILAYDHHHTNLTSEIQDTEQSKECSNLIATLSELYTFQVVSCVLMYDIIRELLNHGLRAFDVEILLKLLRTSGNQLRLDDPMALQDIIEIMNSNLKANHAAMSSRTKFMVETVTNLKDNKIKRNGESSGFTEGTERLKKFISGLSKKHHVKASEPLRASLGDLREAETKGKWWLVGSAWAGDPLIDSRESKIEPSVPSAENVSTDRLLKLARKQGMNTDIRRSIFFVLMSSEDYIDACERLSHLHLTAVQQREIVRVIFNCCGNEKEYNPYYTLVAQRLCTESQSHKVTLQYCLWDFFRDIGEKEAGGMEMVKALNGDRIAKEDRKISTAKVANLSRALAWLVAKDASSLTVFKSLNFTVLKEQSRVFLRNFFKYLFISTQTTSPLAESLTELNSKHWDRKSLELVVSKASRISDLSQGLLYIVPTLLQEERKTNAIVEWAVDVLRDTLISDSYKFTNMMK